MSADINEQVERLRQQRDLILTEDGTIESPQGDSASEPGTPQAGAHPQEGLLLKPNRFGG